jgi:hypothetical protein
MKEDPTTIFSTLTSVKTVPIDGMLLLFYFKSIIWGNIDKVILFKAVSTLITLH